MKPRSIADLIPFLNFLNSEKIHYRIEHLRDDSIMVSFTLVALRIELDFFEDHVEFSTFKGDESVEDDSELLLDLIRRHWSDD